MAPAGRNRHDASVRYGDDYAQHVLATPGLVAYWRLGEKAGTVAYDRTGRFPGTYLGSPTLGVTGALAGDADTAVTLASASAQSVQFSDTGWPSGAASRSIVAWAKPAALGTNQCLITYGTNAGTGLVMIFWEGTGTGNYKQYNATGIVTLTPAVAAGDWAMIAACYDGSGWQAYVNGVPQTRVLQVVDTVPGGVVPYLGSNVFNNRWNGDMDEVAVFDRVLTAGEVAGLYSIGTGR